MLNSVCLCGRLGHTPELRRTQNGKEVTNLSVAVPRDFDKDKTDWFTIVAWEQQATYVCQYGAKGRLISIRGRLQTREYTARATGEVRKTVEIVADSVGFLDKRDAVEGGASSGGANPPGPRAPYDAVSRSNAGGVDISADGDWDEDPDGDLPF